MDPDVVCAQVGSMAAKRFGWARRSPTGTVERHPQGDDIAALSRDVIDAVRSNRPIAVGFECPLAVPVPTNELALGRARAGDVEQPWSEGVGAGLLATGLAEMAWVLRAVGERCSDVSFHTDWRAFCEEGRGLFVWEALVTEHADGGQADEAVRAVRAFAAALPDPTRSNAVGTTRPFSLAAAAALWAGLTSDVGVLHRPVLALKV
jgi:hypothetical protein